MRIALVRGNNLNRFEMQSYEPLASRHEITGYGSFNNNFETNIIKFPIKRLHIIDEYYNFLPSPAKGLLYGFELPLGMNNKMFGLEKELNDKDILHAAETHNGYSYQCAKLKKEKNKKLVLTVWENIPFLSTNLFKGWDNVPVPSLKRALKMVTDNKKIVDYIKNNTDVFIAVTDRAKKALMVEGVSEELIKVIPVGIDTEVFKPRCPDSSIIEKLGISDTDYTVLFIGRLAVEKGIYDLLYSVKLLSYEQNFDHVKIVIVGNGPEKDKILTLIDKMGIKDKVKLAGSYSYLDVPYLYNVADAFILPSIPVQWWQEQFGMVLLEAMASGLPVISTLSGSIPEVVGNGGILVQPNDPLSLCQEIKSLVQDREYGKKIGLKARERAVEEFNITKISRRIEAVYEELYKY